MNIKVKHKVEVEGIDLYDSNVMTDEEYDCVMENKYKIKSPLHTGLEVHVFSKDEVERCKENEFMGPWHDSPAWSGILVVLDGRDPHSDDIDDYIIVSTEDHFAEKCRPDVQWIDLAQTLCRDDIYAVCDDRYLKTLEKNEMDKDKRYEMYEAIGKGKMTFGIYDEHHHNIIVCDAKSLEIIGFVQEVDFNNNSYTQLVYDKNKDEFVMEDDGVYAKTKKVNNEVFGLIMCPDCCKYLHAINADFDEISKKLQEKHANIKKAFDKEDCPLCPELRRMMNNEN